jgi:predicted nucleotidyltransferase
VPESPDFAAILRVLVEHGVDFIVVGGVCGVLHGAPIATFDLDVVHSRTSENVDRLLAALEALDARYRGQGQRRIKPQRSHLSSPGHQLLITQAGPLDLLGVIGDGLTYPDLLTQSAEMEVGSGIRIRVLNLDALVTIKEELGREKDKAVLAVLRRTLEESSKRNQSDRRSGSGSDPLPDSGWRTRRRR